MKPIAYLFKDKLFRMRLHAYYDMPKFNDDHDMTLQHRMLQDVALTFGVIVAMIDAVMFVFHVDSTDVLSVTRYKVDEYEVNCTSAFYSEHFNVYLLPEVPKEVNNVLVEYSEEFAPRRQEKDTPLLH